MSGVKSIQTYQSVPFNMIEADLSTNVRTLYTGLDELAESISNIGQQSPISVYKEKGVFYVVEGFRRYSAIKSLVDNNQVENDFRVKVHVIEKPERGIHIILNLVSNGGVPFTPVELARAFKELYDLGFSQMEIAKQSGRTQPDVSNHLKLLTLPQEVIDAVNEGKVAFNTAIAAHRAKQTDALVDMVNEAGESAEPAKKVATVKQFTKEDRQGEGENPISVIKKVVSEIEKGNFPGYQKDRLEFLKDILLRTLTEEDVLDFLGV